MLVRKKAQLAKEGKLPKEGEMPLLYADLNNLDDLLYEEDSKDEDAAGAQDGEKGRAEDIELNTELDQLVAARRSRQTQRRSHECRPA